MWQSEFHLLDTVLTEILERGRYTELLIRILRELTIDHVLHRRSITEYSDCELCLESISSFWLKRNLLNLGPLVCCKRYDFLTWGNLVVFKDFHSKFVGCRKLESVSLNCQNIAAGRGLDQVWIIRAQWL